jgi:hypothetical protein
MRRLSVVISLVLLLGGPGPAPGAERHWLEGTWIVHFSTDQRPRLFEVTKVSRSFLGGGWRVEATYGYADGARPPVEVALEGRDDDIEVGTLTLRRGQARDIVSPSTGIVLVAVYRPT